MYQGTTPFVGNLYDMLNDPESQKAARYRTLFSIVCSHLALMCLDAVRWSDDGMRVVLISVRELEKALPKYFNHNNYRSLTKMMTAAGFRKVPQSQRSTPNCVSEYYHENFQRGRVDLLPGVFRPPDYVPQRIRKRLIKGTACSLVRV